MVIMLAFIMIELIRIENIRKEFILANIVNEMRKLSTLVKLCAKKTEKWLVRRVKGWNFEEHRIKRGKPKMMWVIEVKNNMKN